MKRDCKNCGHEEPHCQCLGMPNYGEHEPARPSEEIVRVQQVVLALEAIYAAIVDMEQFVNSTTDIHYKRREQLRAKTSAVREAVQAVRQNVRISDERP